MIDKMAIEHEVLMCIDQDDGCTSVKRIKKEIIDENEVLIG